MASYMCVEYACTHRNSYVGSMRTQYEEVYNINSSCICMQTKGLLQLYTWLLCPYSPYALMPLCSQAPRVSRHATHVWPVRSMWHVCVVGVGKASCAWSMRTHTVTLLVDSARTHCNLHSLPPRHGNKATSTLNEWMNKWMNEALRPQIITSSRDRTQYLAVW